MAVKKVGKKVAAPAKKAAKKVAKKAAVKRVVRPRRSTVLHDDGSIENALREIQRVFNLPEGSVRLVNPSGRRAYSTIGHVRKAWK